MALDQPNMIAVVVALKEGRLLGHHLAEPLHVERHHSCR
jgi:hypothetical protein